MYQKWFQLKCSSVIPWEKKVPKNLRGHPWPCPFPKKSYPAFFGVLKFSGTFFSQGITTGFIVTSLFFNVYAFAMPKLLQQVEAKYSSSSTLKAQFKQKQFSKTTGATKNSSGKLYVKRPSKIRWETEKPEPNLLIGNGKTYWFYTPPFDKDEKGQVIERSAKQVQTQLADALISGRFSMNRDMQIIQKTPSTFLLVPKPGTAGTVANATVVIDPQKELIEKVILDHKGGNRAEIDLSSIELGEKLDENLFQFSAPPNTDQITE